MSTFDPAALECLAAIVEEGGFERAAQRLSHHAVGGVAAAARAGGAGRHGADRAQPAAAAHRGRPTAAEAHQAAAAAARRPRARPAASSRPVPAAARAKRSASRSRSTPTASPPGPCRRSAASRARAAAGDHHRRPGLHAGVAARRPGARLRDHARSRRCAAARCVPLGADALRRRRAARRTRASTCRKAWAPHNFRDTPFIAFNRKDDMQASSSPRRFGLKRVTLNQVFVPSSEGQVRAVLAGWGVSVVPELLVRGLLAQGAAGRRGTGHARAGAAVLALLEPGMRIAGPADRGAQAAARQALPRLNQRGAIAPWGRANRRPGSSPGRPGRPAPAGPPPGGGHPGEGLDPERFHGGTPRRNLCAPGKCAPVARKREHRGV